MSLRVRFTLLPVYSCDGLHSFLRCTRSPVYPCLCKCSPVSFGGTHSHFYSSYARASVHSFHARYRSIPPMHDHPSIPPMQDHPSISPMHDHPSIPPTHGPTVYSSHARPPVYSSHARANRLFLPSTTTCLFPPRTTTGL